ncbi:hypothetical protein A2U01_0084811, partial [Trifolium medium]|nr:hypothetical protein [Trifolium medium]
MMSPSSSRPTAPGNAPSSRGGRIPIMYH